MIAAAVRTLFIGLLWSLRTKIERRVTFYEQPDNGVPEKGGRPTPRFTGRVTLR
jgi:hypothetical protein